MNQAYKKPVQIKAIFTVSAALLAVLLVVMPQTSKADNEHGRGRAYGHENRGHENRGYGHRDEWREHERYAYSARHHRGYYQPHYVYAPPAVIYDEPEPSVGLNLIVPFNFH